jgi:PhnB protein
MPTRLNPYISFQGNAREAMTFYQTVFGGKLEMDTFKQYNVSQDPAEDNKIMHAMLEAENGMALMGADTMQGMPYTRGDNFSISLSGDNHAELQGYFDKLAAGGTISMPLEQAPWGDTFGMLTDKFGVSWMVNIAAKQG